MSAKIKMEYTTKDGDCSASPSKRARRESSQDPNYFATDAFRQLNEFQKHGQLCDFTIHTGKKKWKVHRIVMAARSEYLKECLIKNPTTYELKIECDAESALNSCVGFMYTNDISVNQADIEKTFLLSSMLKLYKLTEYCCDKLMENLSVENCLSVWKTAAHSHTHSGKRMWEKLEIKAGQLIFANFKAIDPAAFKDLSKEELIYLLGRSPTQTALLAALSCWISKLPGSRHKDIPYVLKLINLTELPFDALNHMINNPIIFASPEALEVLNNELLRRYSAGLVDFTIDNWSAMRDLFITFKMKDMEVKVNKYVIKNFSTVCKSVAFCKIDKATLVSYLQASNYMNLPEKQIWDSLLRWTKFHEERRKCFPEVLKSINLSRFSFNFISSTVRNEPLVENDKECLNIVIDALLLKQS